MIEYTGNRSINQQTYKHYSQNLQIFEFIKRNKVPFISPFYSCFKWESLNVYFLNVFFFRLAFPFFVLQTKQIIIIFVFFIYLPCRKWFQQVNWLEMFMLADLLKPQIFFVLFKTQTCPDQYQNNYPIHWSNLHCNVNIRVFF